jgi:hypothetical protein
MANSVRRLGGWAERIVALTVALLVSAYLVVSAQKQASRAAASEALEPSVVLPNDAVFGAPPPLVEPRGAFVFSSKSLQVELEHAPSAEAQRDDVAVEAASDAEVDRNAEDAPRGSTWLFSSKSPVPIEFDRPQIYGPTPFPPVPFSEGRTLRRIDPAYLPSSKFPSPLRAPTSGPTADKTPADSAPKTP